MSLMDINAFGVVAFVFFILLVAMFYSYDKVYSAMLPVIGASTPAGEFMTDFRNAYFWLDYAVVFMYVGFLVSSIVSAWFVRTHPVFFLFFMIGSLFSTFLAWTFLQVSDEFINAVPDFMTIFGYFPITGAWIWNLPILTLGSSIIIAIIQYSKTDVV